MLIKRRYLELLENFDSLPPTAIVPIPVAAAWRGISEKTIRRNFSLVVTSDHRRGVGARVRPHEGCRLSRKPNLKTKSRAWLRGPRFLGALVTARS
jgi:hypothetical protein